MQYIYILMGIALTALCWGSYGPLFHEGQHALAGERLKPLICVGLAYLAVGVILPCILLAMQGELWTNWTVSGFIWSFAAGTAGAIGALGIIIAMTNGGAPWLVMPLVFGLAPIVTTFISLSSKGLWSSASPLFFAGIILVLAGAVTVLLTAPKAKPAAKHDTHATTAAKADTSAAAPEHTQ